MDPPHPKLIVWKYEPDTSEDINDIIPFIAAYNNTLYLDFSG